MAVEEVSLQKPNECMGMLSALQDVSMESKRRNVHWEMNKNQFRLQKVLQNISAIYQNLRSWSA